MHTPAGDDTSIVLTRRSQDQVIITIPVNIAAGDRISKLTRPSTQEFCQGQVRWDVVQVHLDSPLRGSTVNHIHRTCTFDILEMLGSSEDEIISAITIDIPKGGSIGAF